MNALLARTPAAVTLRAYQQDGVQRMRERIAAGAKRVLACGPTGMGKTVLAAAVIVGAVRKGKRVLFLAHRRELINQCYAKLRDSGLDDVHLGVVLAGDARRRPNAPVQIASVQTLVGRAKPPADLVFVDECHHANATTYGKILDGYPDATVVGLTATPCRADGRGLGDIFAEIVPIVTFRQLVAEGFLVAPRVFTSRAPLDLSAVKTTGGDYNLGQLGAAMNKRELVGDIVEHWLRIAEGRSTIVFASSVEHSQAIVEQFRASGVTAEHLDGETLAEEREAILARLASGETRVVCNMGVLTEGFDCPRVKCVVLARPTKSLSLFLQCAGRGLRPWEGVSAILLDHAGCVQVHGFPQDDREWSLEGKKKRAKAPAVRTCPSCYAALPAATPVCPECGHVFERAERGGLEQREGELIEVVPPAQSPVAERREWYRAVLGEASQRGRKLGWARHRYHEKFGAWPNGFRAVEAAAFSPEDPQTDGAPPTESADLSAPPVAPSAAPGVPRAARRARLMDLSALLPAAEPEVESWSL